MMYIIYCYLEKQEKLFAWHKNSDQYTSKLKNAEKYMLLWVLFVF